MADTFAYHYKQGIYLNITNRCTNNCIFCFKNFQKQKNPFAFLLLKKEPKLEGILGSIQLDYNTSPSIREIIFCGLGEPLLRLDEIVLPAAKIIKEEYRKNVRINTNGHALILYPGRNVAEELKDAGVGAVSISLNAENSEKYNRLCRPKFNMQQRVYEKVKKFGKACKKIGLETEFTAVEIPRERISSGIIASIEKCRKISIGLGIDFRKRDYIN
ncbi:TatD family nuclease-associated radical SAM protein [Candidatus Pacearchaeota archaeon]|nr:TatD family nuclease-associated radical SAM protein [Candidatus Pacearchaeota archaeon]